MRSIFNKKCEDYGVSPVIGVILVVAITVILAAVVGVMVFGFGDMLEGDSAREAFEFDEETGTITPIKTSDQVSEYEVRADGQVKTTIPGGSTGQAIQINDVQAGTTVSIVNPQTEQVVQEWTVENTISNGNDEYTLVYTSNSDFNKGTFDDTTVGSVVLSSSNKTTYYSEYNTSTNYREVLVSSNYVYAANSTGLVELSKSNGNINDFWSYPTSDGGSVGSADIEKYGNVVYVSYDYGLDIMGVDVTTGSKTQFFDSEFEVTSNRVYTSSSGIQKYYKNGTHIGEYDPFSDSKSNYNTQIETHNGYVYVSTWYDDTGVKLIKVDPSSNSNVCSETFDSSIYGKTNIEVSSNGKYIAIDYDSNSSSAVFSFDSNCNVNKLGKTSSIVGRSSDEIKALSNDRIFAYGRIYNSDLNVIKKYHKFSQAYYNNGLSYTDSPLARWNGTKITEKKYNTPGRYLSGSLKTPDNHNPQNLTVTITDFKPANGHEVIIAVQTQNTSFGFNDLDGSKAAVKQITSKNSDDKYTINSSSHVGNTSKVFVQMKDTSGEVTTPSVDKIYLETKKSK